MATKTKCTRCGRAIEVRLITRCDWCDGKVVSANHDMWNLTTDHQEGTYTLTATLHGTKLPDIDKALGEMCNHLGLVPQWPPTLERK